MEHFMCTNKSTQGRHSFGSEMKEGKSRIFVERGHRKFDFVRRLSRSSSFLVCSFFIPRSLSQSPSSFFGSVLLLLAPDHSILWLFFCHHRAYNSHFMSPLPLTLFFSVLCAAAVVWELRTQRYEFTNFMTPFFTHSPTDRPMRPTQCVLRGLFFASRRSGHTLMAGVEDNVKLKSTLEWKMEWKIRRLLLVKWRLKTFCLSISEVVNARITHKSTRASRLETFSSVIIMRRSQRCVTLN